jgi:tRNA(Ile2) C34 agmatinyltransferase TiaS
MRAADDHYDGGEKICPWCGEEIEADGNDWRCDECEFSDEEAEE